MKTNRLLSNTYIGRGLGTEAPCGRSKVLGQRGSIASEQI